MAHNNQIHEERAESHRLENVRKKNTCKKFTKAEAEHSFKRSYEILIKTLIKIYKNNRNSYCIPCWV